MARSLKKGPFIDHNLEGKVEKMNQSGKKNPQLKHGHAAQLFHQNL